MQGTIKQLTVSPAPRHGWNTEQDQLILILDLSARVKELSDFRGGSSVGDKTSSNVSEREVIWCLWNLKSDRGETVPRVIKNVSACPDQAVGKNNLLDIY